MKRSVVRRSLFVLVVCALLAGSFFAGRLLAVPKAVQAQAEANSAFPAGIDSSGLYFCPLVVDVAVMRNIVYVRCDEDYPGTNIELFAYPTGGANGYTASRMLAIGQTAFVLGYPVWILFDYELESNPPDCPSYCRLLTGISMVHHP